MNVYSGFTIIELLIVVGILGVLSGVIVAQFTDETKNSADASVRVTVSALRTSAITEELEDPSGANAICNEVYNEIKGSEQLHSAWTATGECGRESITSGVAKICCASNAREWVIWGGLSTFDTGNANAATGDIFCTDDDGYLGRVDFTLALNNANKQGFVVSGTGNYKCN